jgi:hypothetical protein
MNPASRESQNARNPAFTPGLLAKSITCSGQIKAINQSLPNSSRTTSYPDGAWLVADRSIRKVTDFFIAARRAYAAVG